MSTRGTVIFLDEKLSNMDKLDPSKMEQYTSIYVHADMYPSGALPRIMDFLEIEGAKNRAFDYPYLGAWFVAFIANGHTQYNFMFSDEDPMDTGARYIKEIRARMTKGKRMLKELKEQHEGEKFGVFMHDVFRALGLDINKFMKECPDLTGVGLQIGLNDWCDFTYLIVPATDSNNHFDHFDIYVYGYDNKLIDVVTRAENFGIKVNKEGWFY